jgi:hypothetical protein
LLSQHLIIRNRLADYLSGYGKKFLHENCSFMSLLEHKKSYWDLCR